MLHSKYLYLCYTSVQFPTNSKIAKKTNKKKILTLVLKIYTFAFFKFFQLYLPLVTRIRCVQLVKTQNHFIKYFIKLIKSDYRFRQKK